MTRPLRAALYARCSSLKQADRDLSVPAQLDACRQHAARKGWHVVEEHHDDGISGFEDERRPDRHLRDLAAGAVLRQPCLGLDGHEPTASREQASRSR